MYRLDSSDCKMTKCQLSIGKYLSGLCRAKVNKTVNLGLRATMNNLVKLAMAKIEYLPRRLLAPTFSSSDSANLWNLSGSMWHTSPRLPENKHCDSADRTPITLLNSSMNTEPPESEKTATLGSSVNLRLRMALAAGCASAILRNSLPSVSYMRIRPDESPTKRRSHKLLSDRALIASFDSLVMYSLRAWLESNRRTRPLDVPMAIREDTSRAVGRPACERSMAAFSWLDACFRCVCLHTMPFFSSNCCVFSESERAFGSLSTRLSDCVRLLSTSSLSESSSSFRMLSIVGSANCVCSVPRKLSKLFSASSSSSSKSSKFMLIKITLIIIGWMSLLVWTLENSETI
ncbi:hypothetical protein BpHYR1_038975 [Brachionus plicatilis]|uniref:Uncharacterized protein n=1 Tax=Brachionus plicatilis TaxID=10195 RepID=A0A3M7SGV3_BRAPC|nr:hypothetical protein BpHYR1_038975 [Brachionus plicatilis]